MGEQGVLGKTYGDALCGPAKRFAPGPEDAAPGMASILAAIKQLDQRVGEQGERVERALQVQQTQIGEIKAEFGEIKAVIGLVPQLQEKVAGLEGQLQAALQVQQELQAALQREQLAHKTDTAATREQQRAATKSLQDQVDQMKRGGATQQQLADKYCDVNIRLRKLQLALQSVQLQVARGSGYGAIIAAAQQQLPAILGQAATAAGRRAAPQVHSVAAFQQKGAPGQFKITFSVNSTEDADVLLFGDMHKALKALGLNVAILLTSSEAANRKALWALPDFKRAHDAAVSKKAAGWRIRWCLDRCTIEGPLGSNHREIWAANGLQSPAQQQRQQHGRLPGPPAGNGGDTGNGGNGGGNGGGGSGGSNGGSSGGRGGGSSGGRGGGSSGGRGNGTSGGRGGNSNA